MTEELGRDRLSNKALGAEAHVGLGKLLKCGAALSDFAAGADQTRISQIKCVDGLEAPEHRLEVLIFPLKDSSGRQRSGETEARLAVSLDWRVDDMITGGASSTVIHNELMIQGAVEVIRIALDNLHGSAWVLSTLRVVRHTPVHNAYIARQLPNRRTTPRGSDRARISTRISKGYPGRKVSHLDQQRAAEQQ